MKRKSLLWISAFLLLILAGCSSSDNDENDDHSLFSNMLQISNDGNANTGNYAVTNGKFYINRMPPLDNEPGLIFHCDIESSELKNLIIRFRGVKTDMDGFQVGESFQLNQFNASLVPVEDDAATQYEATQGSIKLTNKKGQRLTTKLTFQIYHLTFENGYIISGTVDFEYEGTVF